MIFDGSVAEFGQALPCRSALPIRRFFGECLGIKSTCSDTSAEGILSGGMLLFTRNVCVVHGPAGETPRIGIVVIFGCIR
jgi:hypothetical protein